MRKRTVGCWMAAAAVAVGSLSLSVPAGAEGGLTLEERVERLERKGEPPLQLGGVATLLARQLALALQPLDAHLQRESTLCSRGNTE